MGLNVTTVFHVKLFVVEMVCIKLGGCNCHSSVSCSLLLRITALSTWQSHITTVVQVKLIVLMVYIKLGWCSYQSTVFCSLFCSLFPLITVFPTWQARHPVPTHSSAGPEQPAECGGSADVGLRVGPWVGALPGWVSVSVHPSCPFVHTSSFYFSTSGGFVYSFFCLYVCLVIPFFNCQFISCSPSLFIFSGESVQRMQFKEILCLNSPKKDALLVPFRVKE